MEAVVLAIVAVYVAKIMIEDASFNLRGRPSPRQAARAARANGRPKPSGRTGEFRRYLGDVWADAWSDASRRHHDRHQRRQSRPPKTRRPAGPARTYLRNRASGARDGMSRRWAAGWERAEARHQRRQQPAAAPADQPAAVASAAATVDPQPVAPDTSGATDDDAPQTPEAEPSGSTTPTPSTTEGEPDMPTSHGEVTGLRSAIEYANELASQAEQAVTELETLTAGLQSGGTGANTVGKFTTAGEHLGAAAGQLRDAARDLVQQLSVTEAYEANPDAGEKSFVTAD